MDPLAGAVHEETIISQDQAQPALDVGTKQSPETQRPSPISTTIDPTLSQPSSGHHAHHRPSLFARFYSAISSALSPVEDPTEIEASSFIERNQQNNERYPSSSSINSHSKRRSSSPASTHELQHHLHSHTKSNFQSNPHYPSLSSHIRRTSSPQVVHTPTEQIKYSSAASLEKSQDLDDDDEEHFKTAPAVESIPSLAYIDPIPEEVFIAQESSKATLSSQEPRKDLLELLPHDEDDSAFFPNTLGEFFWELLGFTEDSAHDHQDPDEKIIVLDGKNSTTLKAHELEESFQQVEPLSIATRHDSEELVEAIPLFSPRPPIKLQGGQKPENLIMNDTISKEIIPHLPPLLQEAAIWKVAYNLEDHGASIHTLYDRTLDQGPALVVFKDEKGVIFGCFCSDGIEQKSGFSGNGSCFVWKWNPDTRTVDAYHATGENDYFVLCEPHCMAFGGGQKNDGIDECLSFFSQVRQCCVMSVTTLGRKKGRQTVYRSKTDLSKGFRDAYVHALYCCVCPLSGISSQPAPPGAAVPSGGHLGAFKAFSPQSQSNIKEVREQGDTLILSKDIIKAVRESLLGMVKTIKSTSSQKEMDAIFCMAAEKILSTLSSQNALTHCSDVRDFIVVCGQFIGMAIKEFEITTRIYRTPEQFDDLLFQILSMIMSIVRMKISSSSKLKHLSNKDILMDKQVWAPLLNNITKSSAALDKAVTEKSFQSANMMAYWLKVIYHMDKKVHEMDVLEAKKMATERILYEELRQYKEKTMTMQFDENSDFDTFEAFESWKSNELKAVQIDMSLLSRYAQTGGVTIPPVSKPERPHECYSLLLSKCLDYDLRNGSNQVTLSKMSHQVLQECATRWHLGKIFREIVLLDMLTQRYVAKEVLLDDVYPTFKNVVKLCKCTHQLRKSDKKYFLRTLKDLEKALHQYLSRFFEDFRVIAPENAAYADASMQMVTIMLFEMANVPGYQEENNMDPGKMKNAIKQELAAAVNTRYSVLNSIITKKSDTTQVRGLTLLAKAINQDINKFSMYYPTPILSDIHPQTMERSGGIALKEIAVDTFLKYLILEMENLQHGILANDYQITETLDLYKAVRVLYDVCEETNLEIIKHFSIEAWLEPFIFEWLDLADQKCLEWVNPAVQAENYTPILPPTSMYSSSVLDIFRSFYSALDFIDNFNWRESGKRDKVVQKFIQTLCRSLQEYCILMFEEYERIMALNSCAPVDFSRESCIKLNNVMGAYQQLKELLSKLGVGDETAFDPNANRTEPDPDNVIFKISILRATKLRPMDWSSSDPYVLLRHKTTVLEKTKVIDKSLNPVWNETFTIKMPHTLSNPDSFLDFVVMDKDILGDDVCGSSTLFMRDRLYNDYLSKEIKLDLEPQGSLYIRIIKEGQVNDACWWIKKVQETLTFTIQDMIRVNTEQISRYMTACMKTLFPSNSIASAASNFFASFTSNSSKQKQPITVSDSQMEEMLFPLLSYLDAQLGLFNEYLDPQVGEFMTQKNPWMELTANVLNRRESKTCQEPDEKNLARGNELSKQSHVYGPNLVLKIIWHECLNTLHSQLLCLGTETQKVKKNPKEMPDLSAKELTQVLMIECVLEMIKSLFYSSGPTLGGFSLKDLEDSRYSDVRDLISAFKKQIV